MLNGKKRASAGRRWSKRLSRRRRLPLEQLEPRQMFAAHIVGSNTSYATIQAAVNAAAPGAVINVDAGTYNETVTINEPLTIQGAKVGVDARTRSTTSLTGESIVYATQTVFAVNASDVTIDGFTIQGNDANIGANLGAGVLMAPSIHGTHVLDDIIQNNVTGIYLSNNSNTDAAIIQHNYIQDNFEAGNLWTLAVGENGSRAIYSDGTVSGGLLTNALIDSNIISNKNNYNGGDEDEGLIALQALTAGKQFNIAITNNQMSYGSKALLATNVTNLVFMGNTVTSFNDSASGPVRFEGNANSVDIQYNTITGNSGPGVAVDSSGVAGDSSGFVVNNNNIYSNDGTANIGLIVTANVYDGSLTATGDYWGSSNGPGGEGTGSGARVWGDGSTGHGVVATGKAGGIPITFSPWATALINITSIPVPATPTGLGAAALSTSSVQLSWTPVMSTATSQLVQRSSDGVNFTTIATVPALLNAFADTGLAAGTTYTYRIIAANATGNSAASSTVRGTTLSNTGGSLALSALAWTSATAGYGTVQKNTSISGNPITLNGATYASGIGTHAASTITYALNGAYTMFSSAVGIDGEEDSKGIGSVDFTVIGDGVTLFDSGILTNDQVKQVNVNITGVKTLTLVATNGVAGSIDYDHADWAGATLSSPSTLPFAPTNLTAMLVGGSAKLTWAEASSNQTAFTVQRSTDGVNFTTLTTAVAPSATSYTDPTTLTPGTTYTYVVIATNANGSASSNTYVLTVPAANAISVALSSLTPTTATTGYGLVMTNKTVNGNTISLGGVKYASGMGVHAVSNLVYNLGGLYTNFTTDVGVDDEENGVGTGSVDFQVIGDGKVLFDSGVLHNGANVPATHVSVSVAGVKTLTLVATNGVAGDIDYDHSDWAGATLLGTPALAAVPSGLVATALTSNSVKLSWTAESNVTTYTVERSIDNVNFTTVSTTVAGTATGFVDPTTLAASTVYYYRIRAVNAAGTTAASNVASTTTKAQQTITYLSNLNWTSATAGYGTVQKDQTIVGNTITLNGVTYAKGIGTHASSTIVYNLAGAYSTFVSTVGVDQEEDGRGVGSVDFQVFGDGTLLFDSGVLTNDQTANIAVSIAGVKTLTLVANNGVAGSIDYDHSDWAGAEVLS